MGVRSSSLWLYAKSRGRTKGLGRVSNCSLCASRCEPMCCLTSASPGGLPGGRV